MVSKPNPPPEHSAKTSKGQQPAPEALLDDLKAYKRILNDGLKTLPKEATPENIQEDIIKNMKTLQDDLREKIEEGIKSPKYKSTRDKLDISADAVSINANKARLQLSIIRNTVGLYKAADTRPEDKIKYTELLHNSLGECRDALQKALDQFAKVSLKPGRK